MNRRRFSDDFDEADADICDMLGSRDWRLLMDADEASHARFHRSAEDDEMRAPKRRLKRSRDKLH